MQYRTERVGHSAVRGDGYTLTDVCLRVPRVVMRGPSIPPEGSRRDERNANVSRLRSGLSSSLRQMGGYPLGPPALFVDEWVGPFLQGETNSGVN